MFTRNQVLFDGSSGDSSNFTSVDVLVADYNDISLSVFTDTTAASRFTLQASNDDGLRSAIANRSDISTVVADGVYQVDTGMRWLRCVRSSLESLSEVRLQLGNK